MYCGDFSGTMTCWLHWFSIRPVCGKWGKTRIKIFDVCTDVLTYIDQQLVRSICLFSSKSRIWVNCSPYCTFSTTLLSLTGRPTTPNRWYRSMSIRMRAFSTDFVLVTSRNTHLTIKRWSGIGESHQKVKTNPNSSRFLSMLSSDLAWFRS